MLITNFASGELSPNLNGRVDLQQYYQGASKIENFEIIPTGGIKRRVGTQRLAQLSGNNRIIPFIVDKYSVYVLEFGLNPNYDENTEGSKQGLIKVWKQQVTGEYTVIQTIYTDYSSLAVINELQYAQNYDTLIIVHRSFKPFILKLTAERTFTYSEMEFDFYPDVELDDDFDFVMVVAGADFPEKETTTDGHGRFTYKRVVAGVAVDYTQDFNAAVNDFWCIKDGKLYKWDATQWTVYGADPEIDTQLFGEETKYPGCVAFFNNRLFFASTILNRQKVWASAAPDSYGTKYNDFATYKKYVTVNKVVKESDLHIFTCSIASADIDTTNHRTTLRNLTQNFTADGTLKEDITKYYITSSTGVLPVGTKVLSVTSNTMVIDTDVIGLTYAAADTVNNRPAETVKDNLVMSIQLWRDADAVSAEDYEYMVVANNITTADCSLFFELASDQNDAIMFLSSNRFLAIGTESSIWSIDPGINALSINAIMQGRYGSDEIQGQAVETATVYFAQGKKGIREFYYDGQSDAFRTNNIALVADHILRESPVKDFDYMTNPYSRLLVVRNDGVCAQMLYDKTNGIMAWSRIVMTHGKIQSCAVTRGDDENDFIFFVVKQGSGQNEKYFLEVLDFGKAVYLDSWKLYANVSTDYEDGAVLFNATTGKTCAYDDIPEGFISVEDVVYIGYLFSSYIKSMPVVSGDASHRKRITALYVRFLESYMPVMKCTDLADEKFTTVKTLPYSGIAKITYPGITDHDVYFELIADKPEAVNILSVDAQTA